MYVYIYIYIYIYIHAYILLQCRARSHAFQRLTYIHTYIHTYTYETNRDRFDLGPPLLDSGLQMVVNAKPITLTTGQVLAQAFGSPQALAVFAVLVLTTISLAYGAFDVCLHMYMCVCTYLCIYIYIYIYDWMICRLLVFRLMCVYACVYIYIYIYTRVYVRMYMQW
jgi:hypothetical protein